jgi:hypothetical protein
MDTHQTPRGHAAGKTGGCYLAVGGGTIVPAQQLRPRRGLDVRLCGASCSPELSVETGALAPQRRELFLERIEKWPGLYMPKSELPFRSLIDGPRVTTAGHRDGKQEV